MKNSFPPFAKLYLSEVLGARNYLCPEPVHSLRVLKGGVPCNILLIVFKQLSSSQKKLLKKIMASIDIFEFSVLEIKSDKVLELLLSCEEYLARFICFFGGKDLVKEKLLFEQEGVFVSSYQKGREEENQKVSFLQVFSLEELEGDSTEIRNKKKQVWEKLKKWKKASGF